MPVLIEELVPYVPVEEGASGDAADPRMAHLAPGARKLIHNPKYKEMTIPMAIRLNNPKNKSLSGTNKLPTVLIFSITENYKDLKAAVQNLFPFAVGDIHMQADELLMDIDFENSYALLRLAKEVPGKYAVVVDLP